MCTNNMKHSMNWRHMLGFTEKLRFRLLVLGHDTTASGIAWTLYSLAEHPEFQQQCQDEIDSLLVGRENVYRETLKIFHSHLKLIPFNLK